MNQVKVRALLLSGLLSVVVALPVAADFLDSYKAGREAIERQQWAAAARLMREAITGQPEEKPRLVGKRYLHDYVPHYYLGVALFGLGDCPGALSSWAESERQGLITKRKEYQTLSDLRRVCKTRASEEEVRRAAAQVRSLLEQASAAASTVQSLSEDTELGPVWAEGTPSLAARQREAGVLLAEAGSRLDTDALYPEVLSHLENAQSLASESLRRFQSIEGDARRLRGEILTRKLAERTRQLYREIDELTGRARSLFATMDRSGGVPSRISRLRRDVEQIVAQTGSLGSSPSPRTLEDHRDRLSGALKALQDAFQPPPAELIAAVDAYFSGSYDEVVAILGDRDLKGKRTRAHAALLLAAARFALYRAGGEDDEALLAAAREAIREAREAEPGLVPLERAFSPGFIAFFNAGGSATR